MSHTLTPWKAVKRSTNISFEHEGKSRSVPFDEFFITTVRDHPQAKQPLVIVGKQFAIDGKTYVELDEANAEFIVIACNAHEALIEVTDWLLHLHHNVGKGGELPTNEEWRACLKELAEVLKLAKGKIE